MENKNEKNEFIKSTIFSIFEKIGVSFNLDLEENGDEVWFLVKTEDPVFSFGEIPQNISALNTISRRIFEQKFKEDAKFLVDINGTQKKHAEDIKDQARMHAQRVRYFKKDMEMRPMNAYERRLVHTVLQEYPDIETASIGEGFERRVVVKPVSLG